MGNRGKRALDASLLALGFAVLLSACKLATKPTDLEEFVDTGLSMVDMRSCSIVATDGSVTRLSSGQPITVNVVMVNPKGFNITYSLSYDLADSFFSTTPTTPVASDPEHASFNFAFLLGAEHKTLNFTLGKYVAAINKTYEDEHFSVICDSPPNAATVLSTTEDSSYKAVLNYKKPAQASDDDIAKAEIHWTKKSAASPASGVETRDIGTIAPGGACDPFQPAGCAAGYSYIFSVVLIDAAGQRSSVGAATSAAHSFNLAYDDNGSTSGAPPASSSHSVEDTITVPNQGSLMNYSTRPFVSWNMASDGSGASYIPGSTFAMPAQDLTLYAQWATASLATALATIHNGGSLILSGNLSTSDLGLIRNALLAANGNVSLDLTNATLGSNSLPGGVFSGCARLSSILLPGTLNIIGDGCFSGCTGLTSLSLPDSVTSAGGDFISGCTNLTALHLGSQLGYVPSGPYMPSSQMFEGPLPNLSTITVSPSSGYYSVIGGVLYGYNSVILIRYPPAQATSLFNIPSGTMTIGYYAFQDCQVGTIVVPTSINNIMAGAFGDFSHTVQFLSTSPGSISNTGGSPFGSSPPPTLMVPSTPATVLGDYQAKWPGPYYTTF